MKYVGVDIGGTAIKAGLITQKGEILEFAKVPSGKTKKQVLKNIIVAIDLVMKRDVAGIGVGIPGTFDRKTKTLKKIANLPLSGVKLASLIQKEFRVPVEIENDANCFVLAEKKYGVLKKYKHALGISLGTGYGCSVLINGELYVGRGSASEYGHARIGSKTVEDFVSVRALKSFAKPLKIKDTVEIFHKAREKNKHALKAFKLYGKHLGITLLNLITVVDPEVIVLGGQIANAKKFFEREMKQEMKKGILAPCPILYSKFKEPGVLGAAGLFSSP